MPQADQTMLNAVQSFRLPRFDEIPDVGLYLEQTVKYVNEYCRALGGATLTSSMVSNYVKMGLVENAVKKQYGRTQIATLIFIAVVKSVLSLENIRLMVELQKKSYDGRAAYDYFCGETEGAVANVFGERRTLPAITDDWPEEKLMLRNTIVAVAHKMYVERFFAAVREQQAAAEAAADKAAGE